MAALQNKRLNLLATLTLLAVLCLVVLCGCASTAIAVGEGEDSSSAGELTTALEENESNVRQREEYLGQLGRFEGLSAETELQILWDYTDYFHDLHEKPYGGEFLVNDILVFAYYGTYNGWIVVNIGFRDNVGSAPVSSTELIGGIGFSSFSRYLSVWKDGVLYWLQDAYCRHGVLTVDDLQNIKNILDNGRGGSR